MRVRRSARSIEPSNSAMLAITTAANNYIFLVFASCTHVGNDALLLCIRLHFNGTTPFRTPHSDLDGNKAPQNEYSRENRWSDEFIVLQRSDHCACTPLPDLLQGSWQDHSRRRKHSGHDASGMISTSIFSQIGHGNQNLPPMLVAGSRRLTIR